MRSGVIGAVYGLLLLLLSLAMGSAGHGIVTPLLISSAPIPAGLISSYVRWLTPMILLLTPFLWGALATVAQARRRWLFPIAIGVHYISAAIYSAMVWQDDFNDPYRNVTEMIRFAAPYLAAFGAIYLWGQFWLWRSFVRHMQRLSHHGDSSG